MRTFLITIASIIVGLVYSGNALAQDNNDNPQAAVQQPLQSPDNDEDSDDSDNDNDEHMRQVNRAIAGQWRYGGPSVEVTGKNLLAGVGKGIAKGKIKKKLNKAYKKLGLHKAGPQVTFNEDGTCSISLLGANIRGRYRYDPDNETVKLRWHGIPLNAHLRRDGNKKLHLTFDADKLLWLLRLAGGLSNSSALKAVSVLTSNYEDVLMGFELKR